MMIELQSVSRWQLSNHPFRTVCENKGIMQMLLMTFQQRHGWWGGSSQMITLFREESQIPRTQTGTVMAQRVEALPARDPGLIPWTPIVEGETDLQK